ncbi:enoyl-CoA hydratase-related protein [soil metagenome]
MDEAPVITRQAAPGVVVVSLNRPQALNALNTAMGAALLKVWQDLVRDADLRCVVMTGEGRAFCAGAELKERNGMTDAAWAEQHVLFEDMTAAQLAVPVPILAAVHGPAMGGGCEMALACDFTWAADNVRFGLPEARLGIMPGLGGPGLLVRAIGERAALEIMTSGRPVLADEALALGLVTRICPVETLLDQALELANQIATAAPLSVKALKRVVRAGHSMPLTEAMALELNEYNRLFRSADRLEGIGAFNERRAPQFRGV